MIRLILLSKLQVAFFDSIKSNTDIYDRQYSIAEMNCVLFLTKNFLLTESNQKVCHNKNYFKPYKVTLSRGFFGFPKKPFETEPF
jgi:hypothetical protein